MAGNAEAANLGFKDRKVRLVVLGILQIILGGLCALIVPLMLLGMAATAVAGKGAVEGLNVRMMVPGLVFYIVLAVWFIWMGMGSVKARRWARALILISSWLWFVSGVCGFIFVLAFIPSIYDKMGESGEIPKSAVAVMKYVIVAFWAVIFVVIPGVLVLLYSGRDVKATCESRDPKRRWTDKCPLPVLAVSFVAAVWAVSLLSTGIYKWAIPFFGIVVSGMNGAIVALVLALVLAYIAWGTYKLDIKAWWCAMLVNILWFLSAFITFSTVGMEGFYEKMDFPEQQLEMMKQYGTLWESGMSLILGFWVIVALVYLIYIRRYFINAFQKSE